MTGNRKSKLIKLLVPIAALGMSAAVADASEKTPLDKQIQKGFTESFGNAFRINQLANYIGRMFAEIDKNGDGIDRAEIELNEKIVRARTRSQIVSRLLIYDLDGDATIKRDEVEAVVSNSLARRRNPQNATQSARLKRQLKTQVDRILAQDPNGDGKIEPAEYNLVKPAKRRGIDRSLANSQLAKLLLSHDPNKDGKIAQTEALIMVGAAFKTWIPPKKKASARVNTRPLSAECKAPKVPKNARMILVGTYEGSGVPTTTITGQDRESSTAWVNIESGDTPLYLMITARDAMIWQFKGATSRIAHAVIMGPTPGHRPVAAGTTGLPSKKLTFLPARTCLRFFSGGGGIKEARAKARAKQITGRDVDSAFAHYRTHKLSLPSGVHEPSGDPQRQSGLRIISGGKTFEMINGKVQQIPKARRLSSEFLRFSPGGLIDIDHEKVVSKAKAVPYDVLPQQAGLMQLVSEGALTRGPSGEFIIHKKIRIPAGLNGAHSVKFLLKAGVPEPDGRPGHSCLFSEDRGKAIKGSRCR